MRPGSRLTLCALALAASVVPVSSAAQAVPRLTVDSVRVSADTVGIGDGFELRLWISTAEGSVLFFPDSLYAPDFEPSSRVQWQADRERSVVEVTYPLIAFQVGALEIPEFEVYGAAREEGVAAGMASTGDLVGSFDDFIERADLVPSARLRTVPAQDLWVASVLLVEDVAVGLRPRPPADVAGGSLSLPALLLGLISAIGLAGALWFGIGQWQRHRNAVRAAVSARDSALAALEELRESGAHRDGRTLDFFARSSEVVRRYVETLRSVWSPALTSTELMHDLRTTPEGEGAADLSGEMAEAEAVKFGGHRPDAEAAEEHWGVVYEWIQARPNEPVGTEAETEGS